MLVDKQENPINIKLYIVGMRQYSTSQNETVYKDLHENIPSRSLGQGKAKDTTWRDERLVQERNNTHTVVFVDEKQCMYKVYASATSLIQSVSFVFGVCFE